MRQVRRGVFETNSSSTHSICIATNRNTELSFPDKVYFRCNKFGWEHRRLYSVDDKASYLYSSILDLYDRNSANEATATIMDYLSEVGVECEFDVPVYCSIDKYSWCENASIDHCGADDHSDFVDQTVNNRGRLLRYLFSDDSFVLTGNDNSYCNVDINVDYPHEEYYKGN